MLVRAGWSACALAGCAAVAAAQNFNVDVGPSGSTPPASYAGAGIPGTWNNVRADHVTPFTTGSTPQDVMLVDVQGNQTTVGFHQYGGMDLVTNNDPSISGNDALLLNDHLSTHSLTLENCMYLNGLEDGTYEVITYAWMPNSPSTQQLVRFDGVPGSQLVGGSWPGAHAANVTYSRDIVEVTNGHLGWHVGIPSGGATFPGAAFNGFQLRRLETDPVPLPSWAYAALAAAVAAAGALVLRRTGPRAHPAI